MVGEMKEWTRDFVGKQVEDVILSKSQCILWIKLRSKRLIEWFGCLSRSWMWAEGIYWP